MPVQTIRTKNPLGAGSSRSLVEEVRKKAGSAGNQAGHVLVVFGDATAKVYYEGDPPAPQPRTKRRKVRRSSAA